MTSDLSLIIPDWPAPASVRSMATTRLGGVSNAPWDTLNLGDHVGDSPVHVATNRTRLARAAGLPPEAFGWLSQVHGVDVARLPEKGVPVADACVTDQRGHACAILTADCLPVLFCNVEGTRVGAAHAGWRGLCAGVLEKTIAEMGPARSLMAWLGPAIGPAHFEVGPEVRKAFLALDEESDEAFTTSNARPGHFMADLWQLATQRLRRAGLTRIHGGGFCTFSEPDRFYSYRREGQTGRMASLVWLA
ncbi:peptidoglycan editing factor PgeF [Marinobacter sp.]|uniref:peptidoglycan editing factor PgeF n=1 Tax=Marinobacter sp. TaxID=50741 RepID=UPI00384E538D